jgi:hypothetical protein
MSFTRFHDDPHRIKKQVDESSFAGRYMLNTPGQGMDLPFMEDPQIRLQKWGANLQTNTVNLESDLLGLSRVYNRDLPIKNQHTTNTAVSQKISYTTAQPFIDESRASHPAWVYKDLEQNRWENPLLNPLNGIERDFNFNIQTRIIEKDNFVSKHI